MPTRTAIGQEIDTLPRRLRRGAARRPAAMACLIALLCLSACQNSLYTLAAQKKIYDIKVSASRGGLVRRASETAAASLAFAATNDEVVALTAVPNEGWVFAGWKVEDSGSLADSNAATTTLTVEGAASTVSANFACVVGSGTVGVGDKPSNLQLTISSSSGSFRLGQAESATYSYAATVGGTAVTPTSVAWYRDGVSLGAASTISLSGASLVVGTSYQIGCEVVYQGYAYSAMRTVLVAPPGTLKWSCATGGTSLTGPSIGPDGTIYAGSSNGFLYAITAGGSLKWPAGASTTGTTLSIANAPAIDKDGVIYVTSDGRLQGFTDGGGSGTVAITGSDYLQNSPAIGPMSYIYTGTSAGKLYATRATNPAWTVTINASTSCSSSPSVGSDGTVYVGCTDGNLYAYAPVYGSASQKWSTSLGAAIYSTPAIAADGTIYAGTEGGNLYAVADGGTTGSISAPWPCNLGATSVRSSPVISADGLTIYIVGISSATSAVALFAVNSTGTLKWTFPASGTNYGSAAIASDGSIYFCAGDSLYAVRDSGAAATVRWTYAATDTGSSSPVIGSDGAVYFATSGGTMYAIHGAAVPATAQWPMLGRNARRSGYVADKQ